MTPPRDHVQRVARSKIRTIEELGAIAEAARRAGRKVVLAHGVFDLLHLGHVRHFEAARREGDMLLVTTTADAFVNKGPGRPAFPESLRAEMIASMEAVDYVGINPAATAENALTTIKPDVYVKGADYRNAADDITGKINAERQIVEQHGGKAVFTDDIDFSSSNLINRYLSVHEPSLRAYLEARRDEGALDRMTEACALIKGMKVLVVGDAIVDEYQYVEAMGKSPKENMIATLFQRREVFAGGAIAAANHIASFCDVVDIVTCLGQEDTCETLIRDNLKPNVNLNAVYRPDAPTTRKTRFVETGYSVRKLFEVYLMNDRPLPAEQVTRLNDIIAGRIAQYDLVVVTDFGHGLLTPTTIDLLIREARFLAVNAQSNSANLGFNLITKYAKADYICIDGPEARLAAHDKHSDIVDLVESNLARAIKCDRFVITQGRTGCLAFEKGRTPHHAPALTNAVVDTVGAGDAFFAVTAPMVAAGMAMPIIGMAGNAAGAVKVGIVGHQSSVEKAPFLKFLTALLK